MPLFPLMLNFAWEFVYSIDSFFVSQSFNSIQSYIDVIWALLDFCIIITWFKYGQQFFSEENRQYFDLYSFLVLIASFIMQFAFYYCPQTHGSSAVYSAYVQNAAMSILFLAKILKKENVRGQSLIVAFGKLIGTLSYVLGDVVFGEIDIFVLLMGLVCFLFDALYVYFLFKFIYLDKNA